MPVLQEKLHPLLQACELTATQQADEHFVMTFDVGNERQQNVHLLYAGDLDDRTVLGVLSFAARLDEPLTPDQLRELLEQNGEHKVGYWSIYKVEDVPYLGIGHNVILEDLDPTAFIRIVTTLACEADIRERQFYDDDRF